MHVGLVNSPIALLSFFIWAPQKRKANIRYACLVMDKKVIVSLSCGMKMMHLYTLYRLHHKLALVIQKVIVEKHLRMSSRCTFQRVVGTRGMPQAVKKNPPRSLDQGCFRQV